jgi:hypothetical protein
MCQDISTEPVTSPPEEQMDKVIVNQEQLKESVGQVVLIEGITQRMKAGASIRESAEIDTFVIWKSRVWICYR